MSASGDYTATARPPSTPRPSRPKTDEPRGESTILTGSFYF